MWNWRWAMFCPGLTPTRRRSRRCSKQIKSRSTGEMAYERAALLVQSPFDAQPVAVKLIERRGDRHRVFSRRQRLIVGLLVSADRVFRRERAGDDGGQVAGLQLRSEEHTSELQS